MKVLFTLLSLFAFTGLVSANVTVAGTGKVSYIPDVGYVTVGVVAEGKTAAEAWEKNRLKVQTILAALQRLGLLSRDLQTTNLNVSPKYVHHDKKPAELVGYVVSYDLKVTVRKLDQLGQVLDVAVEAGANRHMNIGFGCSDTDKLLDEARAKAVANARKKANLYATGAGARLGRVLSINENAFHVPQPLAYEHRMAAPGDKSMPISVGEQEMSVHIHLVYDLLPEAE